MTPPLFSAHDKGPAGFTSEALTKVFWGQLSRAHTFYAESIPINNNVLVSRVSQERGQEM